jgi:hypothetical protein
MNGLRCERLLWLKTHHPEDAEKVSTATHMQLNEGTTVGKLARHHFGEGHLIQSNHNDFQNAANQTKIAIVANTPIIYEASFLTNFFFAHADILFQRDQKWHLIEVKKSVEIKYYQIIDSAIQAWIIESSGLKLETISIMHINRNCEFPNLKDLFKTEDITIKARSEINLFELKIKKLNDLCIQFNEPEIPIGPQCHKPFHCPYIKHCWKKVSQQTVFNLPALPNQKKWELYNSGLKYIVELDPLQFKGKTQKAIEVTQSNNLWIDSRPIKKELQKWKWPLHFFDFEAVGLAIPRFPLSKPYSSIPFQFSCHIWMTSTGELKHSEYLHVENSDPRPKLIESLLKNILPEGSIISYNKSFEISVITKLAEFAPQYKEKLLALIPRFVDLLPLFQNYVYHPEFLGSFSIKSVAPALIGEKLNYNNLTIDNGLAALAGAELILNDKIQGYDKELLIKNLLTYCQQDTLAMVELVKWLFAKTMTLPKPNQ